MKRLSLFALVALGSLAPSPLDAQRSRAPQAERAPRLGPDEFRFRIVDADGRAVQAAEVRIAIDRVSPPVTPDPSGQRSPSTPPPAKLVEDLFASAGGMHTDSAGDVRVQWPRGRGLLLLARRGEDFAVSWFRGDWRETDGKYLRNRPQRVRLESDGAFPVLVLNSLGETVNATVFVRGNEWSARAGSARLRTGAVQCDATDPDERLVVGVDALLPTPVQMEIDAKRSRSELIVLRLPPVGSVHVDVLEPDGRRTKDHAYVTLRLAPESVPESARRFESASGPCAGAVTIDGVARFDYVGLGLELDASLTGIAVPTRIHGPSSPGETVSAQLDLEREPDARPASPPQPVASHSQTEGTLSGSLRLDPHVPADQIELVLSSRSDPANGREASASIDRAGRFSFAGFPVGPARLEVWPRSARILSNEERPVVQRLDLVVAEGENHELAPIDLRGKLFAHRVELDGLDPTRPFHARVFFTQSGRPLSKRCYERVFQLPLVFASPWPSVEAEIFAPGYRSLSLRGVGERVQIRLEPGIPVKLRLTTDGVLPAPPRYLKAVLVPAEEPDFGFDWEGPAFDATHTLTTTAWRPGRMQVRWIVARYGADRVQGGGAVAEVFPPQFVDVYESAYEQVFDVSISAEELARILRGYE